ncbi:MAG: carboxymuconolactone decarboxylase family protein [Candidatus Rokuibacteriota bacterium]
MTTRYALGRRQGITEDLVAALPDYEHGPFSERAKVALRYADQMYFDHHKVDDALWAQLRTQFTEDELFELSWAIAEFIALGKVIYVLGVPYGEEAAGVERSGADACEHRRREGA